jgi:hypothetical protein
MSDTSRLITLHTCTIPAHQGELHTEWEDLMVLASVSSKRAVNIYRETTSTCEGKNDDLTGNQFLYMFALECGGVSLAGRLV